MAMYKDHKQAYQKWLRKERKKNMLEELRKSEEVKDVKVLKMVDAILEDGSLSKLIEGCEDVIAKNGMKEYSIKMKDGYSILIKPSRCEVIFRRINKDHIKPINFMEVYPSSKVASIYTRGCYLLKWKTNKQDEKMMDVLEASKKYNERNDMKHSFNKIPYALVIRCIKKMLSLDNNSTLTNNRLVNKDEWLDSKKAIKLDEVLEEEEA